jgi:hypothetical protein
MPLDWPSFWTAVQSGAPPDAATLKEILEVLIPQSPEAKVEGARAAVGRVGDDTFKLTTMVEWVKGQIQVST